MMTDPASADEHTSVIRLADLLKRRGLVGTGGEAKIRIQGGEVSVNGAVETRRRKQLAIGDRVQLGDQLAEVSAEDLSASD